MARVPRYEGLSPRSARASAAARGSSQKANTKPEMLLRRSLTRHGFRYRTNRSDLPGKPDIVFPRLRVVVFVDGDFWHGKNWKVRKAKLTRGHNPDYWTQKIERNRQRDREWNRALKAAGWFVVRIWESQIDADVERVVSSLTLLLRQRKSVLAGEVFK